MIVEAVYSLAIVMEVEAIEAQVERAPVTYSRTVIEGLERAEIPMFKEPRS